MRATLAWSYALLPPAEQCLFRRLAVFAGGCTLETAEAVCLAPSGAEPLELDLLVGMGTLVDQSLVHQREEGDAPRFGMLHVAGAAGHELARSRSCAAAGMGERGARKPPSGDGSAQTVHWWRR